MDVRQISKKKKRTTKLNAHVRRGAPHTRGSETPRVGESRGQRVDVADTWLLSAGWGEHLGLRKGQGH